MPRQTRSLTADETAILTQADAPPFGTFAPNFAQRAVIALARATILHRGLFRHRISRLIVALGGGKPIDITFRGGNFRIKAENNLIEYGLMLHPTYNKADIDFLLQAVADGGTFVDIGCNIGLYTLPLAVAAGPMGQVISIDANPAMAAQLLWHAQATHLSNLTVVNCAVGDAEGLVDLNIRKDDVAIVSVSESPSGEIRLLPLLAILTETGVTKVDALKIDIEGYEDKALPPFLDSALDALLPKCIVIERFQDGDYPACSAAFARHGYVLQGRSRQNSFYQRVPAKRN